MTTWHDSDDGASAEPELQYESLEDWVEGWFLPILWRRRSRLWCEQWFDHAEARARLSAAWQAWEGAYLSMCDGQLGAMAAWFMTVGNDITRALNEASSPFASCSSSRVHDPDPPVRVSNHPRDIHTPGDPDDDAQ